MSLFLVIRIIKACLEVEKTEGHAKKDGKREGRRWERVYAIEISEQLTVEKIIADNLYKTIIPM